MKMMKKLAAILLSVCLVVPCFSMMVFAADGTLQFTDPDATQGTTVTVEGVVRGGDSALGDISVTMTYDKDALEFVSGDDVSGSDGTLTYSTKGDGSETEIRFSMKFNVLKSGDTVIKASDSTATLNSGDTLNLTLGTSTVKAAEGDGTTNYETPASGDSSEKSTKSSEAKASEGTSKITVNNTEYDFSESFSATDIPEGFEETTLTYEGAERKFVKNATSGVVLGYLVDADKKGAFFLYNEESATFSAYVQLYISDTTAIILLSDVSDVKLPSQYQAMELTVNDSVFPAWQDMENDGYYVLYALDGSGNKTLYQYDNTDGTYQRFITPEVTEEKSTSGILGKIQNFVDNNFILALLGAAVLAVLILIILIVLAVKLHHRNRELDDLYDEYDIPDEYDEPKPKKNQKADKKAGSKKSKFDDDDDDYLDDDDYYDDDDDNDYYDDDDDDDSDYYDDDDDEYYDDDDDYYDDDDEYYDDDDEYEEEVPVRKASKKTSKKSGGDDYGINFIDI